MFKQFLFATALAGALVAYPGPAQAQNKMTTYGLIRCENVNGDGYCPADTRNGVRLVREVGSERCTLGSNWGYERGGIWVSGGCGAEFEIGTPGADYGYGYTYNQGGVIICGANARLRELCRIDTRGGARLIRQLSRAQCIQGETWDIEREGIWVINGCAGEFQVGGGGGGYAPAPIPSPRPNIPPPRPLPGAGPTLVCESDGRLVYCPTGILNYSATLVREFGDDPCVAGRSWGQDQRGVWVNDGCAAEFRIRAGRDPGFYPPIAEVDVVRCESIDGRRNYCEVGDAINVRLLRQNSRSPCIKGRTWGFGRNSGGIWVQNGCRADFRIIN